MTKKVKLDLRDKKLLSILSENSRMPISELARTLKINKDTLRYKVKRLKDLNVITSFYTEVDLLSLGYSVYQVFFLVKEQDSKKYQSFLNVLENNPHTKVLTTYHDRWDIEWVFVAQNIAEFKEIMATVTTQSQDIIIEKNELAVVDYYRTTNLAYSFHPELDENINNKIALRSNPKVDAIDIRILHELSKDSRIPALEIAKIVNLGVDAVIRRIKDLYDKNIIYKFTIRVNGDIVNYSRFLFGIKFRSFTKEHDIKLKEFSRRHPFITRGVKVLGSWDVLFTISTDTRENFHKTISEIKNLFSDIIMSYETWIVYEDDVFNSLPSGILDDYLGEIIKKN